MNEYDVLNELEWDNESMRVMIFGAQGQLGHELADQLEAFGVDVMRLGRAEVDVTQGEDIFGIFEEYEPTHVFNCTAYNAVDQAEQDRDNALKLNSLAPGSLAMAASEAEAVFIHFSTDYVFGDGHSTPIDESCTPAPLSAYGRSKRLGEQLALQNNPRTYVVRCCGLYGERRANFVRTMIRMALMEKPLKVVSDQHVSPTWVRPLSRTVINMLTVEPDRTLPYGIYHAVAHGSTTWYEYAGAIFDILKLTPSLSPVLQADWGAPARRPAYSVLDNALLRAHDLDDMPDWRDSLQEMLTTYGQQIIAQEQAKLNK